LHHAGMPAIARHCATPPRSMVGFMTRFEDLPYRPCVGLAVINRAGRVFVGRRIDGPEHVDMTHVWQMPQGGVDPGEDTYRCALRELYEETNIRSVEHLATIDEWLSYDIPREIVRQAWKGQYRGQVQKWLDYDLPPDVAKHAWKGRYRGQTQKWYALAFTGDDDEIDILNPAGDHEPEFVEWRWEPMRNLPDLVIPFKREVYQRVVDAFAHLVK